LSDSEKPTVTEPVYLNKFNKLDEKHKKLLYYFHSSFTGEWNVINIELCRKILGLKSPKNLYERLNTLARYNFLEIDKSHKPNLFKLTDRGRQTAVSHYRSVLSKESEKFESSEGTITGWEPKPDMDRPHDIWINLLLNKTNLPADWNKRRLAIIKTSFPLYKEIRLKNNKIYLFPLELKGYKTVWIRSTNNKFIIEAFQRKSAELFEQPNQVGTEIITIVDNVAKVLERIFNIHPIFENKINIEISKQSHALIKNQFSDVLLKLKDLANAEGKNIDIAIRREGKVIAQPDRSLGIHLPEYDFPDSRTSEELAQKTKDFIDKEILRDGFYEKINKILETIERTTKNVEGISFYGQHLATHVNAIKSLDANVTRLSYHVDGLVTGVNKIPDAVRQGVKEALSEPRQSFLSKFLSNFVYSCKKYFAKNKG